MRPTQRALDWRDSAASSDVFYAQAESCPQAEPHEPACRSPQAPPPVLGSNDRWMQMSVLLVCPKSRGNTFDVCSYVADNSDAELLVINQSEVTDLKKYKSIILCSGVYGDQIHRVLWRWLGKIEKTSIHENAKIYMFLTWLGRGQSDQAAVKEVKSVLEKKRVSLEDDYITCHGRQLGIIRYGHPNEEDCEKVLNWVRSKT